MTEPLPYRTVVALQETADNYVRYGHEISRRTMEQIACALQELAEIKAAQLGIEPEREDL